VPRHDRSRAGKMSLIVSLVTVFIFRATRIYRGGRTDNEQQHCECGSTRLGSSATRKAGPSDHPKQTGAGARRQRGHTGDKLEDTECGAAQVFGRRIGNCRGKQALRYSHLQAPQPATQHGHPETVGPGQDQICQDQRYGANSELHIPVEMIRENTERIGGCRIDQIHHDQHDRHHRGIDVDAVGRQDKEGWAEPR
jgi:hypothetical protein